MLRCDPFKKKAKLKYRHFKLRDSRVRNLPAKAGDRFDPWVEKIP